MIYHWFLGEEDSSFQDAMMIRKKVFVEEQNVPLELEVDGLDQKMWQVVGYKSEFPVATARMSLQTSQPTPTYKVQRVAVIKAYRGQNIGHQLMNQIEEKIKNLGGQKIVLSAQDQALEFYYKLGYQLTDPLGYLDAGIPHHDLAKCLF